MEYQAYSRANFRRIPQLTKLSEAQLFDMEVVSQVLPFKVNNFVVEQLIDWRAVPEDPIFTLSFPQRDMLLPGQNGMESARHFTYFTLLHTGCGLF